MRPEAYADHYRRFSVYLREYGGTEPFLIASGPSGNDMRWSRRFLDTLETRVPEGWSMHYYEGGPDHPLHFTAEHVKEQLGVFERVENAIVAQRSLLDSYREGKKTALILDEWGVWDAIPAEDEKRYGKLWQQSTMRSAVAAGLGLNLFNRHADKIEMANVAQTINCLHSLFAAVGDKYARTPVYSAFEMYRPHMGARSVPLRLGIEESLEALHLQWSISQPGAGQHRDGVTATGADKALHSEAFQSGRIAEAPIATVTLEPP